MFTFRAEGRVQRCAQSGPSKTNPGAPLDPERPYYLTLMDGGAVMDLQLRVDQVRDADVRAGQDIIVSGLIVYTKFGLAYMAEQVERARAQQAPRVVSAPKAQVG